MGGRCQDLQPGGHPSAMRRMHDVSTRDATHHAWPRGKTAYFGEHDFALNVGGLRLLILSSLFAHHAQGPGGRGSYRRRDR